MDYVYVVVENGEVYPNVYSTYDLAVEAVKQKYPEEWNQELSEVDIPETPPQTELYIEKGIRIVVSKLPVVIKQSGGKRRRRTTRKRHH